MKVFEFVYALMDNKGKKLSITTSKGIDDAWQQAVNQLISLGLLPVTLSLHLIGITDV